MAYRLPHASADIFAITLAISAGVAALFVAPAEAQACSPQDELQIHWTIPADGEITSPDAQVIADVSGFDANSEIILRDGDDVDMDGAWSMSSDGFFGGVGSFVPDSPLQDGEYIIVGLDKGEEQVEATFEVDASVMVTTPESVDFEWYRETHDEPKGDMCFQGSVAHFVDIVPPQTPPAYYRVTFEHNDGSTSSRILHPDRRSSDFFGIDTPLFDPPDIPGEGPIAFAANAVDCIGVSTKAIDGTSSDVVSVCEPDKTRHYAGEGEPYVLGTTDWSKDEDHSSQDAESEESESEEGEGSCAAVGALTPPIFLLILLAVGLLIRRSGNLNHIWIQTR